MLKTASLLLLLALTLPMGLSYTQSGTIYTGEVHAYNLPVYLFCEVTPSPWNVTLTLHDSNPGDAVALAVSTDPKSTWIAPAGAALATYEQPTVTVFVYAAYSCHPFIVLTGVVSRGVNYTVSYNVTACCAPSALPQRDWQEPSI